VLFACENVCGVVVIVVVYLIFSFLFIPVLPYRL